MIRENKYLVLKNADIEKHLSDEHQLKLDLFTTKIRIGRLNDGKQDQQYVVVAADWPMYETVWQMVEAFVDGKPNELEISQAENATLKEQVAQLEREKEYRYVEQILRPIRILLKVAKCAESLADNSEEMEGEDGRVHVGMAADFDELSDALDLLDELPDDKPGYVLGGAAKAAWALRDIIGDTNAA